MVDQSEPWSWSRFFTGFISGRRYGKDHAILLRLVLIIAFWALVAWGALSAWRHFFPEGSKASGVRSSHSSGPSNVQSGGHVVQVDDHSSAPQSVSYTINEAPLGNGILGALFGSKGKIQLTDQTEKEKK